MAEALFVFQLRVGGIQSGLEALQLERVLVEAVEEWMLKKHASLYAGVDTTKPGWMEGIGFVSVDANTMLEVGRD